MSLAVRPTKRKSEAVDSKDFEEGAAGQRESDSTM